LITEFGERTSESTTALPKIPIRLCPDWCLGEQFSVIQG
jgi:hypothetical protein